MSSKPSLEVLLTSSRVARGRRHPSIDMTLANLETCQRHCGTCPSYPRNAEREALFCATGKSAHAIIERGCNCVGCPLYEQCAVGSGAYFCKHGACGGRDTDDAEPDYLERFILREPPEPPAARPSGNWTTRLEFEDDCVVEASEERTILECALDAGVPMTHVCGGQAKCSTCRVLVLDGLENLLPRNAREHELAQAKGLTREIRLACQTRARGTVRLRRLVRDAADADQAIQQGRSGGGAVGRDAEVAVLFSDIRAFTAFAERTLPYDLVHILNRYYESVGAIADRHGGYIDKYLGDGVMIVFGLDAVSRENPSRQAVITGLEMLANLEEFNAYLRERFDHEFRIGVGICTGTAVVGSVGFHKKREYTAIGDTVNTASRIESVTKTVGRPMLVCENTYRAVTDAFAWGERFACRVKGKRAELTIHEPLAREA